MAISNVLMLYGLLTCSRGKRNAFNQSCLKPLFKKLMIIHDSFKLLFSVSGPRFLPIYPVPVVKDITGLC